MTQQSKKLLAKAFYNKFTFGKKHLPGWWAVELDGFPGDYKIVRANGTSRTVTIGDMFAGVGVDGSSGEVSVNAQGNLSVGEYTVVLGENLVAGWEAKKIKGMNTFLLTPKDGPAIKVKSGDQVSQSGLSGLVTVDSYGNPQVGHSGIPLLRKEAEVRLLAFDERDRGGYVSYINTIISGTEEQPKGVKGIFYPATEKMPAAFCEEIEGSEVVYRTAVFRAARNGRAYLFGQVRPLAAAVAERMLYDQEKVLADVAKGLGHNPAEVFGAQYTVVEKSLAESRQDSWTEESFTVQAGLDHFQLPGRDYSPSP